MASMAAATYDLTMSATNMPFEDKDARAFGERLWDSATAALAAADAASAVDLAKLKETRPSGVDDVIKRYGILADYVARRQDAWQHISRFADRVEAMRDRCKSINKDAEVCRRAYQWFDKFRSLLVRPTGSQILYVRDHATALDVIKSDRATLRGYPETSKYDAAKREIDAALTVLKDAGFPASEPMVDDFSSIDAPSVRQDQLQKLPAIARGPDRIAFDDFSSIDAPSVRQDQLQRLPAIERGQDRIAFDDLDSPNVDTLPAPSVDVPKDGVFSHYDEPASEFARRWTSDDFEDARIEEREIGPDGEIRYPSDHAIQGEQVIDDGPMKPRRTDPKNVSFSARAPSRTGKYYINEVGRKVSVFKGGAAQFGVNALLAAVVVAAAFFG